MQNWQPNIISNNRENNKLTIYGEGIVSAEIWATGSKALNDAFPKLPITWFNILREMVKDEKFTDQRFSDAVKSCIKNCQYPEPTIANIIGYDKTIKVYTISELQEKYKDAYHMGATYDPIMNEYERIDFYGEKRWARKEDVKRYNLKARLL